MKHVAVSLVEPAQAKPSLILAFSNFVKETFLSVMFS